MIVSRIKGGLGNQLFCYAAAFRLSSSNNTELVIDDRTGFSRDSLYRRRYELGVFNLSARLATRSERMEPFERPRRAIRILRSSVQKYENRGYIIETPDKFNSDILKLKPSGNVVLDGLWQSEMYFNDVKDAIKNEFQLVDAVEPYAIKVRKEIKRKRCPVAVHIRFFDPNQSSDIGKNASSTYYQRAIQKIDQLVENPHFFIFSDNPRMAGEMLKLRTGTHELVDSNVCQNPAITDFWLLRLCSHFIIANSTFSWWAAWLSESEQTIVVAPRPGVSATDAAWSQPGLLPSRWLQI